MFSYFNNLKFIKIKFFYFIIFIIFILFVCYPYVLIFINNFFYCNEIINENHQTFLDTEYLPNDLPLICNEVEDTPDPNLLKSNILKAYNKKQQLNKNILDSFDPNSPAFVAINSNFFDSNS